MGSTIDKEYKTNFFELLMYVPYLKDDKAKIERFINRLPATFKDQIEYDGS